jgi:hypothetical protein
MNRSRSLLATLLRRYVRSNLDLHTSGPGTSATVLSPLSEERTAIDGKSLLFPAFSPRRGLLPSLEVISLRASCS